MEWIKTSERLPKFGVPCLVYCKIYGRFIATYEHIGGNWGNWHDGKDLGILPPIYWMYLPDSPKTDIYE